MILRSDFRRVVQLPGQHQLCHASCGQCLTPRRWLSSESYCCIAENTTCRGHPSLFEPAQQIENQQRACNGQQLYLGALVPRHFASVIRQGLPTGTKNNCMLMLIAISFKGSWHLSVCELAVWLAKRPDWSLQCSKSGSQIDFLPDARWGPKSYVFSVTPKREAATSY